MVNDWVLCKKFQCFIKKWRSNNTPLWIVCFLRKPNYLMNWDYQRGYSIEARGSPGSERNTKEIYAPRDLGLRQRCQEQRQECFWHLPEQDGKEAALDSRRRIQHSRRIKMYLGQFILFYFCWHNIFKVEKTVVLF